MPNDPKRKPGYVQALDALRAAVTTVVNCYPELESVTVAVGWAGRLRELPAGVLVGQGGHLGAGEFHHAAEQSLRMAAFALTRLQQAVDERRPGGQPPQAADREQPPREPPHDPPLHSGDAGGSGN